MTNEIHAQTGIFATNVAASGWWVCNAFYQHGPSWQMVPPILIGAASFVGALRGYANDRQARQHKDELHRLEVERRREAANVSR
ncbi:hypothetical protein [Singulisphaera acidiphila]|uniref:Uncharacterized protein n=1 Tax=Singulisphaera acidiphila (strain ATCC BAA-1392 / DSM 18658 / VKM B-2454 / MOB10) TaxID=886293 RepID=L0DGA8_SINAD|nr:hypothetical protein [Singulisphaera acidiphila]AGA28394.1 hypothetical protein Sinac_4188 [Singulisphaera acidiphila DSM 18658]